jgi:hypothetical protein
LLSLPRWSYHTHCNHFIFQPYRKLKDIQEQGTQSFHCQNWKDERKGGREAILLQLPLQKIWKMGGIADYSQCFMKSWKVILCFNQQVSVEHPWWHATLDTVIWCAKPTLSAGKS